MQYLPLAPSDLKVSRIGFGCAALSGYDYGPVDDRQSSHAIRTAWDAGVNLFDTSDVYGFGHAEEALAKALGQDRHEAIIATKFGIGWDSAGKTFRDCSVPRMRQALDDSLRRLQVEAIPIYMVHWHDGVTPLPELMAALADCQKQGKIRYLGCSNFTAAMVRDATAVHRLDVIQLPYSIVRREHEAQLLESIDQRSMATIVYDVLARGLLSGKYDVGAQFGDHDTRSMDRYFSVPYVDANLQVVRQLERVGRRHHRTAAQVAIRWALDRPHVRYALVGSKRSAQIAENVDVFDWDLTPEDRAELEHASLN
jgi:aryl-alcohol dehydrogenase-like predicted oxidoreductase